MINKFFDEDGRCLTSFSKSPAYKNSRKYFRIETDRIKKISLKENFENLKTFLCPEVDLNLSQFENRINKIKQNIKKDESCKNLLNGVFVPFILPNNKIDDLGENISKKYLPALSNSFQNKFPNYNFVNHCKDDLKNQIGMWKNSRYEKLINNLKSDFIIGLLFPCLNEFSFPAAIETINNLPDNMILAGGYEILSSIIGCPSLLRRDQGYPPLLWFSSLKNVKDNNICYHVEPYGYNLTFNKRAHLNQATEYWWHSLVIIG